MGEVCGFAGGEQGACYARLCWHRGRGVWPSWASGAWCMVLTIVASVLSPLVRTVHLYVGRSVVLERLEACRTRVLSVIQNRHIPSHPRLRLVINALDSPARQLFAFQLHHRRRLCTLFRRIGMKDQIPNTTDHRCSRSPAALPPSASPPSPLSPSSCRGAAVAPALLSPCVAVAVSRFSLLLLLSLARL